MPLFGFGARQQQQAPAAPPAVVSAGSEPAKEAPSPQSNINEPSPQTALTTQPAATTQSAPTQASAPTQPPHTTDAPPTPPPSTTTHTPQTVLLHTTIGVDEEDSSERMELHRVRALRIADARDPLCVERAFQEVVDCVETLTVTSRDNDAIFFQMLRAMEERLLKRIDAVKEKVLRSVDEKMAVLTQSQSQSQSQSQQQCVHCSSASTPPSLASSSFYVPSAHTQHGRAGNNNNSSNGLSSNRGSIYKPTSAQSLSVLFEEVNESESSPYNYNNNNSSAGAFIVNNRGSFSLRNNYNNNNNNNNGSARNSRAPSPEPQPIYEDVAVSPHAGFVIKTKKLVGGKDKVFINVFHHESIEVIPQALPAREKEKAHENLPFLIMGEVSNALDKEGQNCVTYNVGVSSELFQQPSGWDFNITAPVSIQKIIHKVNLKFSEFLDESSYSLPRLAAGYKGDSIPPLHVPVLAKAKPAPTVSALAALQQDDHVREREREKDHDRDETASVAMSTRSSIAKRRLTRKSIFDSSQHAMNSGNVLGRNMLSGNMLEYIREECVDGKTAHALKEASLENPHVLLGWQIQYTLDNNSEELFVVTDVRKNLMNKTEFRLSKFFSEDIWVRLKRSEEKSGNEFRPMRKVLFGLQDDDEVVIAHLT